MDSLGKVRRQSRLLRLSHKNVCVTCSQDEQAQASSRRLATARMQDPPIAAAPHRAFAGHPILQYIFFVIVRSTTGSPPYLPRNERMPPALLGGRPVVGWREMAYLPAIQFHSHIIAKISSTPINHGSSELTVMDILSVYSRLRVDASCLPRVFPWGLEYVKGDRGSSAVTAWLIWTNLDIHTSQPKCDLDGDSLAETSKTTSKQSATATIWSLQLSSTVTVPTDAFFSILQDYCCITAAAAAP